LNKKNVLVFLNAFWSNGDGMSGGDQVFIQVFKRIRNDIENLWCVSNYDGKTSFEKEIPNVSFIISARIYDHLNIMLSYIMRTISSLNCLRIKTDVIYSGSDFFPDVIPAFLIKFLRPKTRWVQCVFHIYPDWRVRPGNKARNFAAQYLQIFSLLLARNADKIIIINKGVEHYLVRKGFDKNKIIIITLGIDIDFILSIPSARYDMCFEGVFLGRIHPTKGIFDLVEIWNHVVKKIPEARLAIIGSGSKENTTQLAALIKKNNLCNNISMLGFLKNQEAFAIVKASKVFLFPSHEEGFGIAIAEALACKVPVVAWRLPVYEEYFINLINMNDCWDINKFSKSVLLKINNYKANDFCVEKELNKFSWNNVAKVLNNII